MNARRFSLLFAALLLAACTKKNEKQIELNVHYPKVQVKLDPHRMEDAYSMMITGQLFRGLLRFDPSGAVAPDLAQSWTESGDRKTYRFKLRRATFSDGSAITAKNVQLSFARMFLLGASMSADLDYIKGASQFLKTKDLSDLGVKAIGDSEVEFQLASPSALFLKHIAVPDSAILPLRDLKNIAEIPNTFSGPYKISTESPDRFVLTKWRKDPIESGRPPDRIVFFAYQGDPLQLAKENKTDCLDREVFSESDKRALIADGWGQSPTELTGEVYVILNPKIIGDELRKFLFLKVDQEKLANSIHESQFKAAYGLIPAGFPGELSRDNLAEVNGVLQYIGKKFSFKLDYDPASELEKTIGEYLKNIWTTNLISVELNPLTKSEKLRRMFAKESEAVLGRKSIDYPDGFSVLTYFKGKYDSNYFHVDDPKVDRAISESVTEFDTGKRTDLYKKTQLLILQHHTMVPLLFGSQASGFWGPKVKNVPTHPMGSHTMHLETIEMRTQ